MNPTKVLILMGSPRKEGNTAVLAARLAEGAREAGARVHSLVLQEMNVSPCTGCEGCAREGAAGCVVDDDMQDIYSRLRESDAIVFASPVYWFSVTAQLKTVIDRFYAVGGGDRNILRGKRVGILLAYADADPFTSGAVNALRMFQDMTAYLGMPIIDMVYGSAFGPGEIARNEELLQEARELGRQLGQGTPSR